MNRIRTLLPTLALVPGLLALAACSGGASTTQNPNTANATAAAYTGPAPASADVQAFKVNLWQNINGSDRCGACHHANGQTPEFARADDVNQAYTAALTVVNLTQPSQSEMVIKVGGGHNCWLASPADCATILTTWIQNWAGGGSGGAPGSTKVQLQAPVDQAVGPTKQFPNDGGADFQATVYPLLQQFCSRCHSPAAAVPQSPYFASPNVAQAYIAAQPKINLNQPNLSRFYVRLATESHNCWATTPGGPVDCAGSAARMLAAIQAFAGMVPVTPVDPTLVVSRALTMLSGTVASGNNRYDAADIARWSFQEGSGATAYDTSGVDPAINLTLSGDYTWDSAWGVIFGANGAPGKAQGTTSASVKLYNMLTQSGAYSLELWAAPANVTQKNSFMAGYSGGAAAHDFELAQSLFQYQVYGRSTSTSATGAPALQTAVANQTAQAALQHVVVTYDPTAGRKLYVNGVATGDADPVAAGALSNWDNSFAFLLGSDTSTSNTDTPWAGEIRFAAVHNAALTPAQVQQNYAAGVGQLFYLLFDVSALTGIPQTYIEFEVSQFDNYSYLFNKPTFISLNPNAQVGNIPIVGMYIGMNGQELPVGQAYSTLNTAVTSANYSPTDGQLLSSVGTVVPLQLGPANDLFFLDFDQIGSFTHTRTLVNGTAPAPTYTAAPADIGLHVYDELNASYAAITGVSPGLSAVNTTYQTVEQQLPTMPDIQGFLASQQIGIAQLSIQYCSSLVDDPVLEPAFFGSALNLNQTPQQAFGTTAGMDLVITPLINSPAVGANIATQPTDAQIRSELYSLITSLVNCSSSDPTCVQTPTRTATIVKAACATVLGSATTLIK